MKKLKFWGFLVFVLGAILLLPNKVLAETNFDELLTDGKFVVHSVKPTSSEMAYTAVYEYTMMDKYPNYYIDWENSFNEDYTKCKIYYGRHNVGDPYQEVEISYVYDADVKTVVDSLINKLDGKDTFNLNEIEFINYLMNKSEDASMVNYSSELRKAIDYKNFSIDIRMGADDYFYTERGGNAVFSYNDTVYYIKPMTIAQAKHIIYVADDSADVLATIKARLIKVFGTDFNVKEKDTVANFLAEERQGFINRYSQEIYLQQQYNSAEECADAMMDEMYYNEDARYPFVVKSNVYEKYYTLTINDEEVNFLVVKDSSKINDNVNIITNDVESDITISSTSSSIPLDTLIKVSKLTNGTEYENIIKTLNVKNSETFDLSLYSNSLSKNITTGNFEVKIPVSDNLKDKSLIVYYVDENNKIEEHEVTIEDGYAIFTTNHFSIYTLAEKTNTSIDLTPNNPQTIDNITTYTIMLVVSALGVVSLSFIYLKNNKKVKNI